jgi:hypothetical protein
MPRLNLVAMSTNNPPAAGGAVPTPAAINWRRPEFVLTLLGLIGFLTLPIRITTIWGGLPAHPLIIHVPVVLIPCSVLGAIACIVHPAWLKRYGVLLCVVAIVAMSSIFLAMQAGAGLEGVLHLQGPAAHLISEHSQAAHILAVVFTVFTAVLILTFSAERIAGEAGPTGLTIADRLLAAPRVALALKVALVVLAVVSAFMVYRVGDLGARAVWLGRA